MVERRFRAETLDFVRAWNDLARYPLVADIAELVGSCSSTVRTKATRLRQAGVPLVIRGHGGPQRAAVKPDRSHLVTLDQLIQAAEEYI